MNVDHSPLHMMQQVKRMSLLHYDYYYLMFGVQPACRKVATEARVES